MGANMKCDKRSMASLCSKKTKAYTHTKAYEAFALPSFCETMATADAKAGNIQAFSPMPKSGNVFTSAHHLGHDAMLHTESSSSSSSSSSVVPNKLSYILTPGQNLRHEVVPQLKDAMAEPTFMFGEDGNIVCTRGANMTRLRESSKVPTLGHDMVQARNTVVPSRSSDLPAPGYRFGHDGAQLSLEMMLPKSTDLTVSHGLQFGYDLAQSNQVTMPPMSMSASTPAHPFEHRVVRSQPVSKPSDIFAHRNHIGHDAAQSKSTAVLSTSSEKVAPARQNAVQMNPTIRLPESRSNDVSTPGYMSGHNLVHLKQTMAIQESTFKEQLHELHRLYQVQRSLMGGQARQQSLSAALLPGEKPCLSGRVDINKPFEEEIDIRKPKGVRMGRPIFDLESPAGDCIEKVEEERALFCPFSVSVKSTTITSESTSHNKNCWMEEHHRQSNCQFSQAASARSPFQGPPFISLGTTSQHDPSGLVPTSSSRSLSGSKRPFEEEPPSMHLLGQKGNPGTPQGTSKLPHWLIQIPSEVEHMEPSCCIDELQGKNTHKIGACVAKDTCVNLMVSNEFLRVPACLQPRIHLSSSSSSSSSSTMQQNFRPDNIMQLPPQDAHVDSLFPSSAKQDTTSSIMSNVKKPHKDGLVDDMNLAKLGFDLNVPSSGLSEEESLETTPIESMGWYSRLEIKASDQDGHDTSSTMGGCTFLDCAGNTRNTEFHDSGSDDGSGEGMKSSDGSGLTSIDSQVVMAPTLISGDQSGEESGPSVKQGNSIELLYEEPCRVVRSKGPESVKRRCSSFVAFSLDLNEEFVVVNGADVGAVSVQHEVTEAAQLLLRLGSDTHFSSMAKDSNMHKDQDGSLKWLTDLIPHEEDYIIPQEENCSRDERGGLLDSFEMAVLMIKPMSCDDVSLRISTAPGERCIDIVEEEEAGHIRNLRRRSSRRGKGNKDFQRDVLHSVSCLSRQEVMEDLQIIEGLVESTRGNGGSYGVLAEEKGSEAQGARSCRDAKQDAISRVRCSWGQSSRRKRMTRQRCRWSRGVL